MKSLKSLTDLKKLTFNNCQLDCDLLEDMKEALQDNETLTDISLYTNDINAQGAQLISHMLYNKVGLTNLGLSNNMITTGGARELAPCLEGLTKLQKLSMESNLIGNAGCNAIA